MRKKKGFVVLLSLILILALSFSGVAYGAQSLSDLNKSSKQKKSQIQEKKSELSKGRAQENEVKKEIDSLVEDMNRKQAEIDDVQVEINATAGRIDKVNEELRALQKKIDKQTEGLNDRLRNMYMNDSTSFIDVVLNSGSISELLTNVELIKRIHKSDKEVLEALEKNHKKVEKKENELKQLQATLNDQKDTLAAENSQIEAKKTALDEKRAQIHENNEQIDEDIAGMEAAAAAIDAKIKAETARLEAQQNAQANSQNNGGSSNSGSGSSSGGSFNGGSSSSGFAWPVSGPITSGYGWRSMGFHGGIDIGVPYGTPVHASKAGQVIVAQSDYSYGNYVVIYHGNGYSTLYAHNSSFNCHVGQRVSQGQVIAYAGSTGHSTGPHCHFEIRVNGVRQNPRPYLP